MLYLGNEFAPVFDSDLAADGDLPRMKSEVVGDTLGRRRGAWTHAFRNITYSFCL